METTHAQDKNPRKKAQKKIQLPTAKKVVQAYCAVGEQTDPQGSYTGRVEDDLQARPVQDADDL